MHEPFLEQLFLEVGFWARGKWWDGAARQVRMTSGVSSVAQLPGEAPKGPLPSGRPLPHCSVRSWWHFNAGIVVVGAAIKEVCGVMRRMLMRWARAKEVTGLELHRGH